MWRRIWAITQKEFIQFWRYPLVLIGLTVGPLRWSAVYNSKHLSLQTVFLSINQLHLQEKDKNG